MFLRPENNESFGDRKRDIREELTSFSEANSCVAEEFTGCVCSYGNRLFSLMMNHHIRVAACICDECDSEHDSRAREDGLLWRLEDGVDRVSVAP